MSASIQPHEARPEFSRPLRVDRLRRDNPHPFEEVPTEAERAALATALGLLGLRKFRFSGQLRPLDRGGWELSATLGATVSQPCVATLAPVQTRIDVAVHRTYLPDPSDLELSEELQIDADTPDETEPLTREIDLGVLATGELALALPAYPRAAEAPAAADRIEDDPAAEQHRPFAGLAAMRAKLEKDGGEG